MKKCPQGYPLNEVILGLKAEDYHAHPFVSRSQISGFVKALSPRHYWWEYERPEREPFAASSAMLFGTAFHDLILEPETFEARNLFAPMGLDRRKKADKDIWASLQAKATATGAIIHKGEDLEQLRLMAQSVREFIPGISAEGGVSEATIFFECPLTGMGLKVRFDRLFVEAGVARDLKTTADDASPAGFAWASRKFRYDLQAAFYLRAAEIAGLDIKRFLFDVVETKRGQFPGAKSHDLGEGIISAAMVEIEDALIEFAKCQRSGVWPGYSAEVHIHSETDSPEPTPSRFSEY